MNPVASITSCLDNSMDPIEKETKELKVQCKNRQYGALIPNEMINPDIKDSKAYKTYLDFATGKATPKKARKFKKVASPSRKLSPVLEEEHAVKPKRAKRPSKKSTTMPTTGVVIRDTPSESVPKKKTPAKVDRGKGMNLLSDVALLEAAQLKKTLKKSKLETYKLHVSGSGDGVGSQPKVPDEQEDKTTGTDKGTSTKPGVPDVPKYLSESENESWGDSGDDDSNDDDSDEVTKNDDNDDVNSDADGDKEVSDSKKTNSDEDENPNLNQNDDEEEQHEEEYVCTPDSVEFTDDDEEYEELYKDVNVRLQATEHEEEGKGDEEMTDKTEVPLQSSSISSDFANQFLNLDNIPPTGTEGISMMNIKVCPEEPSTQTPPLLNIPVMVILETSTVTRSTIPITIPPITHLPQQSIPTLTPAPTTTTTTTLIPALPDFSSLFGFDQRKKAKDERKRYKDLVEKYVKEIIKDEVKSQLPQILPKEVSNYATLRIKSKESKSSSSKDTNSQPKSSGKSAQAEEPVFETADTEMPQNQGDDLLSIYSNGHAVELEYHFEECYKAVTDRLDWTKPEGHEYLFDLSKPLPLIENQGLQVVPANYFINNDLKYLKGGSSSRKYTTSTTKIKAAKHDTIEGIKDMVPSLWSPVKDELFMNYKRHPHISVDIVLHDIASSLRMDYLPKRRWSKLDRRRSRIMIKAIDQQLFERRLIRNLEKFVGRRDYRNDLRTQVQASPFNVCKTVFTDIDAHVRGGIASLDDKLAWEELIDLTSLSFDKLELVELITYPVLSKGVSATKRPLKITFKRKQNPLHAKPEVISKLKSPTKHAPKPEVKSKLKSPAKAKPSPPPRNLILRSAKHAPPPANPKPKAPKLKASDVTEFDQGVGSGSEEGDGSGSEEDYGYIRLSFESNLRDKEMLDLWSIVHTARRFVFSNLGLEDKILVPKPPRNCARCAKCGTPVDGPYCQGCALLREKFKEELFTYYVKDELFKDLQDTSESSDDNTNVVNAPQEPFVGNQDPGENSSPSPLHIDHCCHECGDSLDGIFCRQCTWGDKTSDTIPETESDEFIKSSVEDLVPIPSESEGIPDKMCDVPLCENTTPLNTLNEHSEIVVNSNDDNSSSDDDYPYGEDIDYVDASFPDVEIVSLEVVEIVDPEVGRIDDDILLTIKDDILREKLLNVNLLIAKIDSLRDNPTPSSEVVIKSTSTFPNLFLEETNTFDNSIPESETFPTPLIKNKIYKEINSIVSPHYSILILSLRIIKLSLR
ncbi:hypothetical protein Tco_1006837 [Tanacetum coccineum]|uniref:Uncharacterized protein n=1 Tax=Tanacetum coccineum TaxID=301880 RepID=A0ABQ5FK04_9ASTR